MYINKLNGQKLESEGQTIRHLFTLINELLWGTMPVGGTPYNGPYREAPPERATFFRLQVYIKNYRLGNLVYVVKKELDLL